MNAPSHAFVDAATGCALFTDADNHRVLCYADGGRGGRVWMHGKSGLRGKDQGELNAPRMCAIGGSDESMRIVFILDQGNSRVVAVNFLNGAYLFEFGCAAPSPPNLYGRTRETAEDLTRTDLAWANPCGLAASEMTVWVVDQHHKRVLAFDTSGFHSEPFTTCTLSSDDASSALSNPISVALGTHEHAGKLFVLGHMTAPRQGAAGGDNRRRHNQRFMRDEYGNIERDEHGNAVHDEHDDSDEEHGDNVPYHYRHYQHHSRMCMQVLVIDIASGATTGALNVSHELSRPENRGRYHPKLVVRSSFRGHPLPDNHGFAVDCARGVIYVAHDPRAVAAFAIDSLEFLGSIGPSCDPQRAAAPAAASGYPVHPGAGREFNEHQMDEAQIRAMAADAAAAGDLHIACGLGVDERFGHLLVTDCDVSRVSVFAAF